MHRSVHSCIAVALLSLPATARAVSERAMYAPPPKYPAEAKADHLTGSGAFALHIRAEGSVERVETLKSIGHPILDLAAIAAFQEWRFHPHDTSWTLRAPIRYADGPIRVDSSMSRSPAPGWGVLATVFSRGKL
jgi:TonB family protein